MVRVLIADDSQFMRKTIRSMLEKKIGISIVGEAQDGYELLEKAKNLNPDVILTDIQMPRMDGLTALTKLMADKPIPTIVFSAFTQNDTYIAIECMERGAVDVFEKPGGTVSTDMQGLSEKMAEKIFAAAKARPQKRETGITPIVVLKPSAESQPPAEKIVIIASGECGISATQFVVAGIPKSVKSGILITQHMPGNLLQAFTEKLDSTSAIIVKQAFDGETIREGVAYIAPDKMQMRVSSGKKIIISRENDISILRNSADILVESAARTFGKNMLGVELTGEGNDGKRAMAIIKMNGGSVICQDSDTSVIFSMPRGVIDSGNSDFVLPLGKIPEKITEIAGV